MSCRCGDAAREAAARRIVVDTALLGAVLERDDALDEAARLRERLDALTHESEERGRALAYWRDRRERGGAPVTPAVARATCRECGLAFDRQPGTPRVCPDCTPAFTARIVREGNPIAVYRYPAEVLGDRAHVEKVQRLARRAARYAVASSSPSERIKGKDRDMTAAERLELTRFRGHLTLWGGGIHHGEIETAIPAGLPAPDGRVGAHRTDTGGISS